MPDEFASMPRVNAGASVRRGTLLMLPARVGAVLVAAVSGAVVARGLGPAGRGGVAVAFTLTTLLGAFGTLGLPRTVPLLVARDPARRAEVLATTLALATALGTGLAAIGLGLRLIAPSALPGVGVGGIVLAVAVVPFSLLATWLRGLLLADGLHGAFYGVELGAQVAVLAGVTALAAGPGLTVTATLGVLLGGRVAAAGTFAALAVCRGRPGRPEPGLARTLVASGAGIWVTTLMAIALARADLLLVAQIRGPAAAGQYAIPLAMADVLWLLPNVVGLNLFVRVARGARVADTLAVLRPLALGFGALCALSMVLADPAVRLVYGAHYAPGADLYLWLAPGVFFRGVATVIGEHLAGTGFPRSAVGVWAAALAIDLGVAAAFLHAGTFAAPLASSVAYAVVLAGFSAILLRRR